jgi:hypothetical protein
LRRANGAGVLTGPDQASLEHGEVISYPTPRCLAPKLAARQWGPRRFVSCGVREKPADPHPMSSTSGGTEARLAGSRALPTDNPRSYAQARFHGLGPRFDRCIGAMLLIVGQGDEAELLLQGRSAVHRFRVATPPRKGIGPPLARPTVWYGPRHARSPASTLAQRAGRL